MKKIKIAAIIMAFILLISTLTGCGTKQKTDTAKEPKSNDSVAVSDENSTAPVIDLDYAETEDETADETVTGHTHSYTANVTKEATCLENGEKEFTCECGDSYKETVPATNHSYAKVEKVTESKVDGKTVKTTTTTYTCSGCGDKYTDTKSEIDIPGHTHSYTAKVTTAATCTKAGVKTYTCSCGGYYTETIPATGHKYTAKVVAPKEFENGYTLHTCSVCGNSYVDTFTAPTHKHSYTSSVTKAATCSAAGTKTYKCKCGDSYTESIAATGHSWETKTVHYDAEYATREIKETYIHAQTYHTYHVMKDGAAVGLLEGDFSFWRAEAVKLGLTELVKCIDAGRIGTYEQMKARDPFFKRGKWEACGNGCLGHLYLCTSDVIYNTATPLRYRNQYKPGQKVPELNLYNGVTHIYHYCDHFEYYEFEYGDGTLEQGYEAKHSFGFDITEIARANKKKEQNNTLPGYIANVYDTSYMPSEKFEKVVGTETYVVTEAHDETVTICSRCGSKK